MMSLFKLKDSNDLQGARHILKMKEFLILMAIAGGLLSALPLNAQTSWRIEEPKNLVVSINTERPQDPPISLEFKEDLVVTRAGWTPWDVQVDGAGNIYVFTGPEWTIRKFDPRGAEIASRNTGSAAARFCQTCALWKQPDRNGRISLGNDIRWRQGKIRR
jgi:hypothetical protein